MAKVAKEKLPFVRAEVSRREAEQVFADDPLKLERLAELGDDEVISTYTDGPFVDLCRGPHVPDTSYLKHFKLLHTAGAYWRGDEHRQMLQRIYGTAWFKKEDLDAYLHRIEEAKRRDHRVLGKQLDLFLFHQFSPGSAFWTERGTTIFNALVGYVRELQREKFQEVRTPVLYNKGLWEISGHWGKYRENMFLVHNNETEEHDTSLKPMNCPSHYLLYLARKHSYRELPLRLATFDTLHRNEVTGALSGLTRVRQFHQDDCHVFLTRRSDRRRGELPGASSSSAYYRTFGLKATVRFATRPEVRIGDDALWDRAEGALRSALEATGMPYELKPGDGAFYGPKIDFDVTDSTGPALAAGDDPARLQCARAVRPGVRGRGQHDAPAGGHSPRRERELRALHRHSDRALRRRLPGVARAGAGARAADHRRVGRRGAAGGGAHAGGRYPGPSRRPQRRRSTTASATGR